MVELTAPGALRRTFSEIPTDAIGGRDQPVDLATFERGRGFEWGELLKSERILVLSEAGVGKTFECQRQQQHIWGEGAPAFFVELAQLASTPLLDMLSPEEEVRFAHWQNTQSEHATFFLDSYDELRLTKGSFRQALTNLSKALAGNLGRARIVITSRPVPFEIELFRKLLPVPAKGEDVATANTFAEIVMKTSVKPESKLASTWRAVILRPLSDDQIRDMAKHENVKDPDALLIDIRRRNAQEFARRPLDLIEICADWNTNRQVRSHREQIDNNIEIKLKPRTDRPERTSLAPDKARDGARRLALAALLSRKLTLRHSAEADRHGEESAALDPADILKDWNPEERATLLERALFGFASYGRVRFHHRSVIEFLAAEQLQKLADRGMPSRALRRLLFAVTPSGERVVKPSMASAAAWLAGSESVAQIVFPEILDREPSLLLSLGDPESLTLGQRKQALQAYVARYGDGGWRGLSIPHIQVHRFATPDIGELLIGLWRGGIENYEVRQTLMQLMGTGRAMICESLLHGVAADPKLPDHERVTAIDAMVDLKSPLLTSLATSLVDAPANWSNGLSRGAVLRLFPKHLSVAGLRVVLSRVSEAKRSIGDISWQLPNLVQSAGLSVSTLEELREALTSVAIEGAAWNKSLHRAQTKRGFVVPTLATTCLALLKVGAPSDQLLRSCVVALRFANRETGRTEQIDELRKVIARMTGGARPVLFDADDALMQSLRPQTEALQRLYETSNRGALQLDPAQDAGWVGARVADISLTPVDRELMVETALRLWNGEGEYRDYAQTIKPHVVDRPELLALIETRSRPSAHARQALRYNRLQAKRDEHQRRRDLKAKASWIAFWREITAKPETVFAADRARNTAWNLWNAMERAGDDSRASGWNRSFMERHFGAEAADRLRGTLMAFWRADKPTLRSERVEEERNTYLTIWQLGLAGIEAEAEDPKWASKLTPEEARLALRYAPLELNGFPAWMAALAVAHPTEVAAVTGAELTLELSEVTGPQWHSMTLQNITHAPRDLARLFLPNLLTWLDETNSTVGHNANAIAEASKLDRVLSVLIEHGDDAILSHLKETAAVRLADGAPIVFGRVWLPLLMRLDPLAGMKALEAVLAGVSPSKKGAGVDWFGSLFGDRHSGSLVDLGKADFTPALLLGLARLAYVHVRPSDDVEHEGTYTPDARDHAERGRGALFSALLERTGSDAWEAKLEMASDPSFLHIRDRILALARETAAGEMDAEVVREADVVALSKYGELPPSTSSDMFALLIDRLDELDDLLLRDDSPREAWALIEDETIVRREIARALRQAANHTYKVDQEAVTADNKETDIRLLSVVSDQQAVIELKVGEKPRSARDLRNALSDQLLKKYMAPENSRAGCLLITLKEDRTWQHPETGAKLDLAGLVAMLNEEATEIMRNLGNSVRIVARGLDLRPRLPTEKAAKAAS